MGIDTSRPQYDFRPVDIYYPSETLTRCVVSSRSRCICSGGHHRPRKLWYTDPRLGRDVYHDPLDYVDRFASMGAFGGGAGWPFPWKDAKDWTSRDYDAFGDVMEEYLTRMRGRGMMGYGGGGGGGGGGIRGAGMFDHPMMDMGAGMESMPQAARCMGLGRGMEGGMSPAFFPCSPRYARRRASPMYCGEGGLEYPRIDESIRDFRRQAQEFRRFMDGMNEMMFGSESERRQEAFQRSLLKSLQNIMPQLSQMLTMQQMGTPLGGGGFGGASGLGGMGANYMGAGMAPFGAGGQMNGMGMPPGAGGFGMGAMNGMNGFGPNGGGGLGFNNMTGQDAMMGGRLGGGMGYPGGFGGGGRRNGIMGPGRRRGGRGLWEDVPDFGGGGGRRRGGRWDDEDDMFGGGDDGRRWPKWPDARAAPRQPRPNGGLDGGGGATFDADPPFNGAFPHQTQPATGIKQSPQAAAPDGVAEPPKENDSKQPRAAPTKDHVSRPPTPKDTSPPSTSPRQTSPIPAQAQATINPGKKTSTPAAAAATAAPTKQSQEPTHQREDPVRTLHQARAQQWQQWYQKSGPGVGGESPRSPAPGAGRSGNPYATWSGTNYPPYLMSGGAGGGGGPSRRGGMGNKAEEGEGEEGWFGDFQGVQGMGREKGKGKGKARDDEGKINAGLQ